MVGFIPIDILKYVDVSLVVQPTSQNPPNPSENPFEIELPISNPSNTPNPPKENVQDKVEMTENVSSKSDGLGKKLKIVQMKRK